MLVVQDLWRRISNTGCWGLETVFSQDQLNMKEWLVKAFWVFDPMKYKHFPSLLRNFQQMQILLNGKYIKYIRQLQFIWLRLYHVSVNFVFRIKLYTFSNLLYTRKYFKTEKFSNLKHFSHSKLFVLFFSIIPMASHIFSFMTVKIPLHLARALSPGIFDSMIVTSFAKKG